MSTVKDSIVYKLFETCINLLFLICVCCAGLQYINLWPLLYAPEIPCSGNLPKIEPVLVALAAKRRNFMPVFHAVCVMLVGVSQISSKDILKLLYAC